MRYWWRLIVLLTIVTSIFGCRKKNKPIIPAQYNCVFVKNSKIKGEAGNFISLIDGNKTVFVYHYTSADYGMTDTRIWEVLSFEVDSNLQSFKFIDEEIEQTNCTCSITVPWSSGGGGKVTSGDIIVKKLESGRYEVTVNVAVPFTDIMGETKEYTIKFKRLFSEYKGDTNQLGINTIADMRNTKVN